MSATEHARNLADVAADKLDRLAADIDTADSLTLAGALEADRERAHRMVVDSRGEAAGVLERLAKVTQTSDGGDSSAYAQLTMVRGRATAESCRRWAAAWRAFADA